MENNNIKRTYEAPKAELIRFSFKDMVVASPVCNNWQGWNEACAKTHRGKYK